MPEAVTTQGETLWIGTNRSAMRRVPYLVSSPEIAGPVSPIDATNLASDARVYIPGLKDYSGDLVWEANSQRYLPGELRDLLAMDGCHVWAERRMPLVGTRVSLEGTASVTMSAASPDSVQRVTVRITPSSAMSVEGWSPDVSDGYMYRITVDSAGMNITKVEASYGGRSLETVITSSTRQAGAANIPEEWDWNGGVGPFGCFYAAFNVDDYVAGTESEEPVCTEAGRLAYRLDPFDLKRSLAGTVLAGTYNVFLVIPTVYWTTRESGKYLYLSSSPRYRTVSGMTAYAHTATLPGGGTKVYPYIAIGVYEAGQIATGGPMLSVPGRTPVAWNRYSAFRTMAGRLTATAGSGFQMLTFFHWTLLKMMAYAVLGTKNGQWALGAGPVGGGSSLSMTGQADQAGPYADSTDQYDKVFVENLWGSAACILGDVCLSDYTVLAGNTLGGADLGGQPSTGVSMPSLSGSWKYQQAASTAAAAWDLPVSAGDDSHVDDPAYTGDRVATNGETCILAVGGRVTDGTSAGIACIMASIKDNYTANVVSSRLSAFLDDYAVGLTDEAPAALMSAPLTLSMGQSTPDEEPEEESAEPTEEPTEEPEENYGEEEETPEETDTIEEDMR